MRLPTLFKQTRNKQYSYTPRYYDERKERLEKLKEKKSLERVDEDYFKGYKRQNYRNSWLAVSNRKKSDKKSQYRIIIIFIIILMLSYAFIKQLNFIKFLF